MDTARVDICYRPLRVGWAIRSGDIQAFRSAVQYSYALWGGRFNPIIIVDHEPQAKNLADLFRVDMIFPIGDSDLVKSFPKKFPYLIKPFFEDEIFTTYGNGSRSNLLDVHNCLFHMHRKPEWQALKDKGIRTYDWAEDDPLADVFLMQLGQYPPKETIHIPYLNLLKEAAEPKEIRIDPSASLPVDTFEYPSIAYVSRFGLQSDFRSRSGWDYPGFYSGDATNLDDLVNFWNLRAADVPLLFIDPQYKDRYGDTIAVWDKAMREIVSKRRYEFDRQVGIWIQAKRLEDQPFDKAVKDALRPFGEKAFSICRVDQDSLGVHPPMMQLGEVSTLGVVGTEFGKKRISFALDDKPFCSDFWFNSQQLVASISFVGRLYGDEEHILVPPFIPELNEFYARAQHFHYDKLRSEPDRIGLVIDVADTSSFIYPLPVQDLFEKVFDLAGFSAQLSEGGLIARQLIAQLGGVDGARAFKIPGVRRLIKTYGPNAAFTKKAALELIGGRDSSNPSATFSDYENLYIESRPPGTKLDPESVFTYLVVKGLFRIGAELQCSECRMKSWTSLDALKQRVICALCGKEFDATQQLIRGDWHYRRSGVLGAEKNAQGAIPVVLTLQQFAVNMSGFLSTAIYSPSLDLNPKAETGLPKCEVDFVWLIPHTYPDRHIAIVGECKDRGRTGEDGKDLPTIDEKDIDKLKRVCDALPEKRFETFIVLAKLWPFTEKEIALAKTLNSEYRQRVILLTARELEPYHFHERTKLEYKNINEYAHDPGGLANATAEIYFKD